MFNLFCCYQLLVNKDYHFATDFDRVLLQLRWARTLRTVCLNTEWAIGIWHLWLKHLNCWRKAVKLSLDIHAYSMCNCMFNWTRGSAMAEGLHDALVSRNSATTKYPYHMALFASSYVYLRHPMFSRFYTIPECDRHTHTETDGQIHDDGMYCVSIASRSKNWPYCTRPQCIITMQATSVGW